MPHYNSGSPQVTVCSDQNLPKTQTSVTRRHFRMSEYFKSLRGQSFSEVLEQIDVIKCSAAQAHTIQRSSRAQQASYTPEDLNQCFMKFPADDWNRLVARKVANQRLKQWPRADDPAVASRSKV